MKFHCDRCKTRYSIADERVAGKILKIRCKNCSAVITVRQGMSPPATPAPAVPEVRPPTAAGRSGPAPRVVSPRAPSPRPESGSALAGAFEQALRGPTSAPQPGDSLSDAPASVDVEWYLAIDGEQSGPFTLAEAQAFVAGRAAADEIFCWSDGFDDWLLVEAVSHLRGLRGPATGQDGDEDEDDLDAQTVIAPPPMQSPAARPAPRPPAAQAPATVAAAGEDPNTPKPLFAATLASIAAEAPTEIDEPKNGSPGRSDFLHMPPASEPASGRRPEPAAGRRPEPAAGRRPEPGDLDLDIGEASRVVRLPLPRPERRAEGPLAPPGLRPIGETGDSGLGRGSGRIGTLGPSPVGFPDGPRPEVLAPRRRSGLLIPLAIGGAVLVTAAVILIVVATRDKETPSPRVTRSNLAAEGLAFQYADPARPVEPAPPTVAEPAEEASPARAASPRRPRTGEPAAGSATERKRPVDSGEVDLTSSSASSSGVIQGNLDPQQVEQVYRRNQVAITRCHEQALKRDPLLKVPKAAVQIRVAPSGKVSQVQIPSLAGEALGICITGAIRRWRFPKSTKGLDSVFQISFR